MPSGFVSPAFKTGYLDADIISTYTKEYLTVRQVGVKFGIDRVIIGKILRRNNIDIRPTRRVIIGDLKLCSTCKAIKPITEFHKRKANKDGLYSLCKKCVLAKPVNRETNKIWIENNRGAVRRYDKKRRLERIKNDPLFSIKERIRISIVNTIRGVFRKNSSTFKMLGYSVVELKTHLEDNFMPGMSWENRPLWHIDHKRPLASFNIKTEADVIEAWSLSNLQPLWSSDNIKKSSWFNGIKYSYKKQKQNV